jgi:hypothetical protein
MELIEKINRNQHVFRIACKNEIYEIHRSSESVSDTWDVFNEEGDRIHDVLPRRTADELHEKLREFALNLLTEQQETLEEAAKRIYGSDVSKDVEYYAFILGAKWQAARMYSEEEVLDVIVTCNPSVTQAKKWFNQFKKK